MNKALLAIQALSGQLGTLGTKANQASKAFKEFKEFPELKAYKEYLDNPERSAIPPSSQSLPAQSLSQVGSTLSSQEVQRTLTPSTAGPVVTYWSYRGRLVPLRPRFDQ